jgi:hypothetical protein
MNSLKSYWQIITFFLVLAMSAGMAAQKIQDHDRRLTTLETAILMVPQMDEKLDKILDKVKRR